MRTERKIEAGVSLKQYGKDADEHWSEVMNLAEKYGLSLIHI